MASYGNLVRKALGAGQHTPSVRGDGKGAGSGKAKKKRRVRVARGHSAAHPGFRAVAEKIAARQGVSINEADRELGARTRGASAAAKRANPRLLRVPGA